MHVRKRGAQWTRKLITRKSCDCTHSRIYNNNMCCVYYTATTRKRRTAHGGVCVCVGGGGDRGRGGCCRFGNIACTKIYCYYYTRTALFLYNIRPSMNEKDLAHTISRGNITQLHALVALYIYTHTRYTILAIIVGCSTCILVRHNDVVRFRPRIIYIYNVQVYNVVHYV
jgi:hypothetical protein